MYNDIVYRILFFLVQPYSEAVVRRCSVKQVFLKNSQNSQENTCARASFLNKVADVVCNFIKKETLAQVFSCGFCGSFKNTFFYGTPAEAASAYSFNSRQIDREISSVLIILKLSWSGEKKIFFSTYVHKYTFIIYKCASINQTSAIKLVTGEKQFCGSQY